MNRNPEEARNFSQQALDLFEDLAEPLPELRNELANAYNTHGLVLLQLGQNEAATVRFQSSVDTYAALLEDHPDNADYLYRYALALTNLGYWRAIAGQAVEVRGIRLLLGEILPRLQPEQSRRITAHSRFRRILEGT